ncbi:hypothetical protein [Mesonia aestuariivivens]|uniref:ATP-binding protein n=1 Tax=Mesonia aestuariivivens TaxID=2796128 RepID=A0ABS6VZA5_9FLAO|nr:hypothetical protein [Mesonia aestuariivivens]MBW2960925.1 hypothetical protein [Mesonia aestuariivivens]
MKKLLILISLTLICCKQEESKKNTAVPKNPPISTSLKKGIQLEKIWESDTLFKTPESVLFYKKNNTFLVSNVNENGWEMDGDGFISEIDSEGNIKSLKLIKGLSSPKGMALIGDTLYVADAKEVAKINLNTNKIVKRYSLKDIKEPQFNDVVAKDGIVYISASNANSIYKIENNKLTLAYQGDLSRPNGLLFRNDSLFIMNSKSEDLKVISKDRKLTTLTKKLGAGDGITSISPQEFIVSDWNGRLFHINKSFQQETILDTREEKLNAADIYYIQEKELLIVPNYNANKLTAYLLKK